MGWNAHQSGNVEPVAVAACGEEGVGVLRQHAGLLRLRAGIDLDKEQWLTVLAADLFGQRLGEACPIDRVNRIEQGYRFLGFIRLQ
jgi:hypothetical protein